jgi:galactokinase
LSAHVTAFAPGRINLSGEHTDYNDGLALPFAIAAGVTVDAVAVRGRRIEAVAVDLGERDSFAVGDGLDASFGWRAFVRGCVAELRRAGFDVRGAHLEISGDVPRGAGLGSSAALSVSLTLALLGLLDDAPTPDRTAVAQICSRVENDWVGARTGLLDQFAALYGERDHALLIDFRSLVVKPVPLDLDGYRFVSLDSGERHDNAASGFNDRRAECSRAAELLGVASLRDATMEMAERLPAPLCARARHIIGSNERVLVAVGAFERGDLPEFGRLLNVAHASLRDNYDVSTPAVEATVARLLDAGAVGARVCGGGFGGAVLGLMPPGSIPPADAIEVSPGPGAWQRAE